MIRSCQALPNRGKAAKVRNDHRASNVSNVALHQPPTHHLYTLLYVSGVQLPYKASYMIRSNKELKDKRRTIMVQYLLLEHLSTKFGANLLFSFSLSLLANNIQFRKLSFLIPCIIAHPCGKEWPRRQCTKRIGRSLM